MQGPLQRQPVSLQPEHAIHEPQKSPPSGLQIMPPAGEVSGFCCGHGTQVGVTHAESPCPWAYGRMLHAQTPPAYCLPCKKRESAADQGALRAARIDATLTKALERVEQLDRRRKKMEAELAAAREETVRLKREKAATEAQELHASFEGGNDGSSFCAGSVQQHALRVTRAVSQLESLVAKLRRHLHESQALSEEHLHQLKQMKQQLKEQQMLLEQREQALTQEKDISSRLRRQCNAATAKTKQLTAASKELQRAAIDLSLKRCSPQKIWERAGATKAPATAPVGAASKSRDAATVAQSTASMHLPGLLNSSGAAQVAAAIASEATRLFTAAQKEMTQGLQQQPIQEGPENDAKQATDTNHPLPQSHWRCSAALSSSFESSLYASRSGWSAAKPSAAGAAVLQPADLRG
ncbi:hypothetical protein cyc_05890 [Cyclospora cayetanensis]|uniref:Uncharacterized protein n=1 Tax=Cyclospora cayetanensis TaxID=88456 RepID=A0A1D3DAK6_9EIME|nr:hypothetical protein cyc_05890 [Cyclospora cayetanensis]